jgi:hypothetical protein
MKLLLPIMNKHSPVRTVKAPWIDDELKKCMVERDWGK